MMNRVAKYYRPALTPAEREMARLKKQLAIQHACYRDLIAQNMRQHRARQADGAFHSKVVEQLLLALSAVFLAGCLLGYFLR